MRSPVLVFVSVVAAVVIVACERREAGRGFSASHAPQAASGDSEPLLLLEDGVADFIPPSGLVADNSRCYVCHMNYMQEEIAVVHARANIGCARCHGNCDAHIADESWASGGNGTPPGIMYPRSKINPSCMACHPKSKVDAALHERFFAGTVKQKHCTDCHGEHRLAERKCTWK